MSILIRNQVPLRSLINLPIYLLFLLFGEVLSSEGYLFTSSLPPWSFSISNKVRSQRESPIFFVNRYTPLCSMNVSEFHWRPMDDQRLLFYHRSYFVDSSMV